MIKRRPRIRLTAAAFFALALWGCGSTDSGNAGGQSENQKPPESGWFGTAAAADFHPDSAYAFLVAQTTFGPRIPGSAAHKKCGDYIVSTLKRLGAEVREQVATRPGVGNKPVPIRNIIGTFNPNAAKRVMLSAHWDTRPRADADEDSPDSPFDGANDGASGVAVLLEFARQLQQRPPQVGVDLFFWDSEDGGESGDDASWCLGSQHWAENPHVPGYKALFNVNFDMVGAKNATFPQEANSLQFAPEVVQALWRTAHELGFGAYFPFVPHSPIVDDHYFVAKKAGIPAVDVIHLNVEKGGFFPHWHTRRDTPDKIDKATLEAVGKTALTLVYRVRGT